MSNKKNILFLREEYGDGQGTYIYPNGEKYVGDWKNGKHLGQGTFTYPNGELCMLENSRMGKEMVKENLLHLMERSMKGNGRKGNIMGKGHTFGLMEVSM